MSLRRIRTKLLIGFGCVVAVVASQGLFEYWRSGRVEMLLRDAYLASVNEAASAKEMLKTAQELRDTLTVEPMKPLPSGMRLDAWLHEIQRALHRATVATAAAEETATRLNATDREADEMEELSRLETLDGTLSRFDAAWESSSASGLPSPEALARLRLFLDDIVLPALVAYDDKSTEDMTAEAMRALAIVSKSRYFVLAAAIAAVVAALIASLALSHTIVAPLEKMTRVSEAIARGERDWRIRLKRSDEFGVLASAVDQMLDSLQAATITRDQLETVVTERTKELDSFFSLSIDILCIAHFSGRFLRVNRAFEEALGYSREELLSLPFLEFIHPDDQEATLAEMEKYRVSGGNSIRFENRYRHKDGSWRQLSWNATPIQESSVIYAAARDVTELRAAEQALRESQENLAITLQSIGDGVLVTDGEGRITRMNPVAEQLTGWTFAEANGRPIDEIFHIIHEVTRQPTVIPVQTVLESGKIVELANHTALIARDGSVRSIADSAAPIRNFQGEIIGVVLVFRDVTQERAADEAEKMRTQRTLRFQQAILRLRDSEYDELGAFFRLLTEECSQCLEVERSSIWLFDESRENIICKDLYERTPSRHSAEARLSRQQYGDYFDAISQLNPVVAEDAALHPATRVLTEGYLSPLGIVSMLDVPIRAGNRLVGVICCEQVGVFRQWLPEEVKFAGNMAGQGMLAIEHCERSAAEKRLRESEGELRKLNTHLEELVRERSTELVTSEQRFRLMIEQIKDYAIFMLDPNGIVKTWNSGAQRVKGYEAEEILGRNFSCFYTPKDIAAGLPEEFLKQAARDGCAKHEGWRLRKDGSRFWADVSITALRDAETGELDGFIKLTRDLSERRKAELALEEALKTQLELTRKAQAGENAKSEFLAIMSHEVRTPMNGIIGYADLLVRAEDLSPENHEYAETLYRSGRALLRILDDILDFSGSDAGVLALEKEPFSPHRLLEDVHLLLMPTAKQKGISLQIDIAPDIPRMLIGDAGRLRQILLNLAGNAVKFTDRGAVTLTMMPAKPSAEGALMWRFSVRDTGPGVTEERQAAIFSPFIQVDASTSRRHGGTGLGLAISKRMARLLGGKLDLDSTLGTGSEFILFVPLEIAKNDARKDCVPENGMLDGQFSKRFPLKILVVEDDRINLKLTLTLLRKLGYDPLAAADGREAVEIFRKEKPSCVLMDIQMPEMDGIEATRAIRDLENGQRAAFIIALTANTVEADRERCFEAGMSDYLNKPIRRELLSASLMKASMETGRKGGG